MYTQPYSETKLLTNMLYVVYYLVNLLKQLSMFFFPTYKQCSLL